MNGFDIFEKDLLKLENALKGKDTTKFLKKQGKKLQKETQKTAKKLIKEKTGKYIKSIKNGKVYDFKGAYSTRIYSGARHAHLIEYGHRAVAKGKKDTGKDVKGYYIFDKSKKGFEDEFAEAIDKYIDDICKQNGF